MIEEEQAWAIARRFAHEVGERWPAEVMAVVVIGSLATGAYRPGRSDIDTVVVLRADAAGAIDQAIRQRRDHYQMTYAVPKGFGAVIVRAQALHPPYIDLEVVPEILRIIEQGQVIGGQLDWSTIPRPADEAISAYVAQFTAWLRTHYIDQRPAEARTLDATVNTILYELRCWLWQATQIYVLDKLAVVYRARALDQGNRFHTEWRQLESYLERGAGFATLEAAEVALRNISAFVRQIGGQRH